MSRKGIALISTFTIARGLYRGLIFAAVLGSLPIPPVGARSQKSGSNPDLEDRVRRLGLPGDSDDLADVQMLSKTPFEAVGRLLRELHPIGSPERAELDDVPETEHIISTIAALRYITGGSDFYTVGGKDFCARTSWTFGNSGEEKNRRYWLYFDHPNCVSFFAIWPSRYRVYLAPLDAQEDIIRRWRQWYAAEGKTYRYTPPPDSPEKSLLLWQCARGVYSPPPGKQQ